jgi:hypothetical protein
VDAREDRSTGTVTLAARVYIALVIAAIASFGLPLYLYPSGAARYWAWTVGEPRTAMLIGSIYFVSTIYYMFLFRQTDWLRLTMSLRSLFVVAAWLLVAAMFHWDSFYPYRPLTLIWLGAYYLPLFFLPILFRLQRERFGEISDHGGRRIAPAWRVWLRARGAAYALAAVALFAAAPAAAASWPWPIEPVNTRMLSGQLAVFGAFQAFDLTDGSWRRLHPFMMITAMMGVAHLPALLLPIGGYDWSAPLATAVLLAPLEWLATSVGLLAAYRSR